MMSETLADRLVDFALATRFEDLPEAVVAEARRRLIDTFGCAAGALGDIFEVTVPIHVAVSIDPPKGPFRRRENIMGEGICLQPLHGLHEEHAKE